MCGLGCLLASPLLGADPGLTIHVAVDGSDSNSGSVNAPFQTLERARDEIRALKQNGANKVVAYCTHPVLSGPAIQNLNGSQLDELVVADTIPLTEAARACGKIRQLSVAELLAETIRRIAFGESVSSLYVD